MKIAIVVPFLDEEAHLERCLVSLDRQTRRPSELVLVDDGSRDASAYIAERFAASRGWVTLLRLPRRPPARDRLSLAAEYQAFQWGASRARPFDAIAKLDADLELPSDFVEALEGELARDGSLGIVGAFLSVEDPSGRRRRERSPEHHVRGATKLYRRECFAALQPLPPILGWDTIDEAKARMHGWRTRSIAIPSRDPLHLRPTGSLDGLVRAHRRWGACAYAAGYHPLWVVLGAFRRTLDKPLVIGSAAYLAGWLGARFQGLPTAPAEVRAYLRSEQLYRLRESFTLRIRSRAKRVTAQVDPNALS